MVNPAADAAEPAALVEAAARATRLLGDELAGSAPLAAVAAAHDLARLADRLVRASVDRARAAGFSWKDIGDVVGTTRQAAFQRFGRPVDPRTGVPMSEGILPGAIDRAVEIVADMSEGRFREAGRDFTDTMAARLDASRLAAAWAQVVGTVGAYQQMGEPHAFQAGDYTVVNLPLHFEAGDLTGRVSFDRDGRVAGLYFLPAADHDPSGSPG